MNMHLSLIAQARTMHAIRRAELPLPNALLDTHLDLHGLPTTYTMLKRPGIILNANCTAPLGNNPLSGTFLSKHTPR